MEVLLDGLRQLKAFRSTNPKLQPSEADILTAEDRGESIHPSSLSLSPFLFLPLRPQLLLRW